MTISESTYTLATAEAADAVQLYQNQRKVWDGNPDEMVEDWLSFVRERAYFRLRARSLVKRAKRVEAGI